MKPFFLFGCKVALLGLVCLPGSRLLAQSAPTAKTYTYFIFHKLSPGLTIQDALPVEREWRVINQAAVDEGKMIGWHMMVKQMSSNPNPDYDYVTVIVSPVMGIQGASPAAIAKIYGDSVQTRMANLQKRDRATAPVVKMEVWETVDASFGAGFSPDKSPVVVVDFMKLRDPTADWSTLVTPIKQLNAVRVRQNETTGAGVSTLIVPKGSEKGYNLIAFQTMANTNVLANPASSETTKLQSQINRAFDVVRQEVFRFTEYTKRPGK
ncbi:hypothetical protein [Spirosoma endbachense]|uniref:hypothetical protein n=1 Tax=Spirosoma endbachense TaxID=2666025 RepID=UPI001E6323A6|nr:hypothetical protein [Spirosoma endbachense]